ncbi:Uncharacterized protein SCF082_LOCUS10638 [Durusdinium trenchii]|uniref:Thioredoxin domain-containing protein n=1 Tax=Durusdinium trenchii TaxID=1381693 RepID=A0ABP0J7U5_9DINO
MNPLKPGTTMTWRPGDIAACFGRDVTSRLISWGTASLLAPAGLRVGPSHVAIICEYLGQPVWVESTTRCRHSCLIRGRRVAGVQTHTIDERVADYVEAGGSVDQYRLTPINRLSSAETELLTEILLRQFVANEVTYDLAGALLSGTRAFQWTRLFPGADLEQLFCSELVAAVAMRLNRMNHANPTRFNPARLLRGLVRTGKYQRIATFAREVLDGPAASWNVVRSLSDPGASCAAALMESAASHQRLRDLTHRRFRSLDPITNDWLDARSYPENEQELASVYHLGFSVVEFLLQQRGPGVLLHFQHDPRPPSRKLRDYYGFDVAALNRSWREWFVARCRLGCDCQSFGCPLHRIESAQPGAPNETDRRTIRVWTASWCGPCQQFWRDVREDEAFRAHLTQWGRLEAVDVDRAGEQASRQGIRKLPTFEIPQGRIEGYEGKETLLEQLDRLVRVHAEPKGKPTEREEEAKPPSANAAAAPPARQPDPEPVSSAGRDAGFPLRETTTPCERKHEEAGTGFLLSLVELATVVGASAATGGAGGLALTLGASLLRRWWRKRRTSRAPPGGVPSETSSTTTSEGRDDGTQAPFPRRLDEARELLELRKSERRVAVLDALRGMFFDDAYEHTFLNADDRERAVLEKLRAEVDARVDEVAPLSTTVE